MTDIKKLGKADRERHEFIIGKTGRGRAYHSMDEVLQDVGIKTLSADDRKMHKMVIGPSGTGKEVRNEGI
ncbi:hypothetical protein GE107_25215 [Cohnella sp. CFH 77786]|uniref:hypothetical protein n=1 Tax=Cohnella sp. CFH 77786 TaxID=2662265 RepID=UPI001C608409|nr:hypothetical protein [Cohnella sp. CFH 77786]MBW5449330.1 hypothetical protein [Cohnella sp. CFH 77786]